ncbi:hypothetical protein [Mycolicibacter senuensis]|uniref:hypothetical protein n=1 Tax=Mycolicibacter senuensis TaxID=386913 RepID=UPI001402AD46|nr:hypothetical protein [Mycolicibacter senuensis]
MQIHRGNIVFTPTPQDFVTLADGYVIVGETVSSPNALPNCRTGTPMRRSPTTATG